MDLRTFVSETLLQIVEGVASAQAGLEELATNARINPGVVNPSDEKKSGDPSAVEFDVALTVTKDTEEISGEKGGRVDWSVVGI